MKNEFWNPDRAEILGAFIGDGWIPSTETSLFIAGHKTDDAEYYDYLSRIFSKQIGPPILRTFEYWHVRGMGFYRREKIKELLKLGFQKGKKCYSVKIPKVIMKHHNLEIKKSVLRGIFDTDGSFSCERSRSHYSIDWKKTHKYMPIIEIACCSNILIKQFKQLLEQLTIQCTITQRKKGFKYGRNCSDIYRLRIRKKESVIKWFEIVGSNNPKHSRKYSLWKKQGFLP